jgi:hypothetical protein
MYEERRTSSGYNVEELGMGLVRLAGDMTLFIEEAWAIHSDNPEADYVCGSKGGLRVEPLTYFTTLGDMEMDATFDVKQADWRWHQCDETTPHMDSSQRHWVSAQLGYVPLIDTAGIALNTAFITEGIYISGHLGHEVNAQEIRDAEPGLGRV